MRSLKYLLLVIGSLITMASFQNCGADLTPLASVTTSQYMFEVQNSIDQEALPRLLKSENLVLWQKNAINNIQVNPLFGDALSFVVLMDGSMTGSILRVTSGAQEARLSVVNGFLRASHYYDGSNYSYVEYKLPSTTAKVMVGVYFGVAKKDTFLVVNGIKQSGTLVDVGSALDFSYLLQNITVGSTGGKVYEAMVFTEALAGLDLNVLSRYISKNAMSEEVPFDVELWKTYKGDTPTTTAPTPQFLAAKAIIDSKCMTCHYTGSANGSLQDRTQAQLVAASWVVAKNPAASKLYYRLRGATSGTGPKSMPTDNAADAASDAAVIATWINSIE